MPHFDDDELILFLYGESDHADAIRAQEASDPALRSRLASLRALFDRVSASRPPEPSADFEADLWRGLEPRIESNRPRQAAFVKRPRRQSTRQLLALAALLTMIVGAFWLGRRSHDLAPSASDANEAVIVAGDRILLTTVGDHLARTERLFLELANAEPGDAGPLLVDNRLYRQSADLAGYAQLAEVLDAVERILTELDNTPTEGDPARLEALRQRLDDQDLLFKVRVLERSLERRIDAMTDTEAASTSADSGEQV